jgi:FMN-dependent NADH-azoreductase
MTTLLRVDASIRVDGSVSRALADSAEAAWKAEHPDGVVVRRDLGRRPLSPAIWPALAGGKFGWPTPDGSEFIEVEQAKALTAEVVDEFKSADAVLLAVPLYNYGLASHVKIWMDLLLTDQELLSGDAVAGRPVILTLARGGGYGPGAPKEGWDHATPYLERIFGEVFKMELRKAEAELTLAPITPGMEALIDASKASEKEAHVNAEQHATVIARRHTNAAA